MDKQEQNDRIFNAHKSMFLIIAKVQMEIQREVAIGAVENNIQKNHENARELKKLKEL